MKPLNKVNKKTGHFYCNGCDKDAGAVNVLIRHKVYCQKCGKEIKKK